MTDEPTEDTPAPRQEPTYPPRMVVGQTVAMKLRPDDIDNLRKLFHAKRKKQVKDRSTGLMRPMTMADMLAHCIHYTRKNEVW